MDDLILKGSSVTPFVRLTASGEMNFQGRCIPENPQELFDELISWFNEYAVSPAAKTVLTFRFEYLNSASVKNVLHLLKTLVELLGDASELIVRWVYEEDDEIILEAGESLQMLLKIPFEFVPVPES
ncbi:MAG: DUF1987 domain-containing protein [Bacteroidales bacterium]|nr:DUF1987 domain-containing protein [Bacteroidales bacterium]